MRKSTSTNSQNRLVLSESCIAHEALARVALRWKVPVLHAIANGATAYGMLRKSLPAVTDQMLGARLRELVAEKLVSKTEDIETSSPRYAVTSSGAELLAIVADICRWAKQNPVIVHEPS